jgi:hypothetical protein
MKPSRVQNTSSFEMNDLLEPAFSVEYCFFLSTDLFLMLLRNRVCGGGGGCTMLQAGRSQILFPMWSLDFLNLLNPCSRTMTLGSTQPLTQMSTRNLLGGKGRPAHKADNLTAVSRLSRKCWSLDVSQPCGPPRPVTGIALPFLLNRSRNHAKILS